MMSSRPDYAGVMMSDLTPDDADLNIPKNPIERTDGQQKRVLATIYKDDCFDFDPAEDIAAALALAGRV